MHNLYCLAISFVHDGAVDGYVTSNDVVDADLRHQFCNEELKTIPCIYMVGFSLFVCSFRVQPQLHCVCVYADGSEN